MNVSVFGLGYVGSVSAASFAADGHTVIGVDVNPGKVATLNEGRSPIVEKGLDELIRGNEGTAIHDFRNPPMTLVGHNYRSDAEPTQALYANLQAPMVTTTIRTAEMIKYASNTWHALKVTFANEVGNLCKRLNIDSHEVMD